MNYTSIMYSHTVPSPGYVQPPLRTGYEYLMAYKTSDNFCKMAEQDGVVSKLTKDRMEVTYKDGTTQSFSIGDTYGDTEGTTYKHTLMSELYEGAKFSKNDPLYYHKDFFERDWLDKKKLVYKTQRVYTVAISVNDETFEDSSAVSSRVMKEMTTTVLKPRKIILPFTSNIANMAKVGDELNANSVLFVDTGLTENAGNLVDSTITMLESLSSGTHRAEYAGTLDRIDVKYNGDIEDMSPTLQELVKKVDKQGYDRTKGTRYEARTNEVTGDYVAKGKKLDLDMIEITIYIEVKLLLEAGSKVVFANQAKSVVGEVFNYSIVGERSMDNVDGMFAFIGFVHRIIDSPFRIGAINRLTRLFSKQVTDAYFK